MNQYLIPQTITFMRAVYIKAIASGVTLSVVLGVFAGMLAFTPAQTVEAACAQTPSYLSISPSGGTVYFASGDTFAEGTYRISYDSGFFSWDSGSHFMFYTTAYGGRGFKALYTNNSTQSVPILRMANGNFATTYYTSEADVKGAYANVYYQFYSTGGKIGVSFTDDAGDNHGTPVKFKLTRVSGGNCYDDSDDEYDSDYEGPLGGSCYANYSAIDIGDEVTFRADARGGNGNYTYSWSGTEGLDGNRRTVTYDYDRSGTKRATVTIRSDGRSITRDCYVTVYDNYGYNYDYNYTTDYSSRFNATCSANTGYVGDTITWSVAAHGGNGRYTYSWDGTNNLSGSNATARKTYNSAGLKTAEVTVRSNGQSITRSCSTVVYDRYSYVAPTYIEPTYTNPINTTGSGVIVTLDQTGPTQVQLSNVPYTGLEDTTKMILFAIGLIGWSAVVAYIFIIRPRLQS